MQTGAVVRKDNGGNKRKGSAGGSPEGVIARRNNLTSCAVIETSGSPGEVIAVHVHHE
jgi:hypothetical protein